MVKFTSLLAHALGYIAGQESIVKKEGGKYVMYTTLCLFRQAVYTEKTAVADLV